MPVPLMRDARPAGWVNCFSICTSAMPKAQNRTAKGSILQEDEELCQYGHMGMINLFLYHTRQPSQIKIFGLHPWLCHTTDKTLSSPRRSRALENFYHTRQPPRIKMCYVEAPIPCKLRTCYLSLITFDPCLN